MRLMLSLFMFNSLLITQQPWKNTKFLFTEINHPKAIRMLQAKDCFTKKSGRCYDPEGYPRKSLKFAYAAIEAPKQVGMHQLILSRF